MIITTGAITFENPNGGQITGSHSLYYVVPYSENGTVTSCPGGAITISNAPTYSASTDVAFYTPCNFTATNGISLTGTIYAGQVASFPVGPALVEASMPMPLTSSTSSGPSPVRVKAPGPASTGPGSHR